MIGTDKLVVSEGEATFKNLILINTPNETFHFVIQASSIDLEKVSEVYGSDYFKETFIEIDFWNCISGERLSSNMCEVCKYGTYSLLNSSTECKECMKNAEC